MFSVQVLSFTILQALTLNKFTRRKKACLTNQLFDSHLVPDSYLQADIMTTLALLPIQSRVLHPAAHPRQRAPATLRHATQEAQPSSSRAISQPGLLQLQLPYSRPSMACRSQASQVCSLLASTTAPHRVMSYSCSINFWELLLCLGTLAAIQNLQIEHNH